MEKPQQEDGTPTAPAKPVTEKRKSRRVLTFGLGLIAGLGLAVTWPKLTPLRPAWLIFRKTYFQLTLERRVMTSGEKSTGK